MNVKEMMNINRIVIKKLLQKLGGDDSIIFPIENRSFNDFYDSNEDFIQISYSIKFCGILKESSLFINLDEEKGKLILEKINYVNSVIEEIQKEVALDMLSPGKAKTYLCFNKVGEILGYCDLDFLIRNKKRESLEMIEANTRTHIERLRRDLNYRNLCAWKKSDYRPDIEDYNSKEEVKKLRVKN